MGATVHRKPCDPNCHADLRGPGLLLQILLLAVRRLPGAGLQVPGVCPCLVPRLLVHHVLLGPDRGQGGRHPRQPGDGALSTPVHRMPVGHCATSVADMRRATLPSSFLFKNTSLRGPMPFVSPRSSFFYCCTMDA